VEVTTAGVTMAIDGVLGSTPSTTLTRTTRIPTRTTRTPHTHTRTPTGHTRITRITDAVGSGEVMPIEATKCPKCGHPCFLVSDVLCERLPMALPKISRKDPLEMDVEDLESKGLRQAVDAHLMANARPHRFRCRQQFEAFPMVSAGPGKQTARLVRESEDYPWEPKNMPKARRYDWQGNLMNAKELGL